MANETHSSEPIELHALARGKVQGVFFRDFVQTHARRLEITGWIRNLPDGATIEVLAQGSEAALQEMLAHLRQGPRGSSVSEVEVQWSPSTEPLGTFEVV
jgi:acylphosphatase